LNGCTPGFFKQQQHFGAWPPPYVPGTIVSSVFDVTPSCVSSCTYGNKSIATITFLDALGLSSGNTKDLCGATGYLLKEAVAALLNGHSEVIAQVNAALASCNRQTILNLADQLDAQNNGVCTLGGTTSPTTVQFRR